MSFGGGLCGEGVGVKEERKRRRKGEERMKGGEKAAYTWKFAKVGACEYQLASLYRGR